MMRDRRRVAPVAAALLLSLPAAGGAGQDAAAPAPGQSARDDGWDAAFTRDSGWNGGDIAHSIDLGDGRTLWLFGDSIVGPVREGARIGGESRFVRGAIAWHDTPEDGAVPGEMTFAIGEPFAGVGQAAWINPAPDLWPEETWYWLMGDGARIRGRDGADRFVLFATAIGPSGAPEGMWNFRQIGGVIFEVENPAAPPSAWRAPQRRNPLVTEAGRHGEDFRTVTSWGLAIVAWSGDEDTDIAGPTSAARRTPPRADPPGETARMLYIYGLRTKAPGDHGLLVARCAESDLASPAAWRFFDGGGWSPDPASSAAIAGGLIDEFTVQPLTIGGERRLVLIQSEPIFGRRIFARTAGRPEGPWSERAAVHEVREVAADERLFTYAAKGHAHLSRPGELLVSSMINSRDFGQIFREAGLYRPRFVRVGVEMLPAAPALAGDDVTRRRP